MYPSSLEARAEGKPVPVNAAHRGSHATRYAPSPILSFHGVGGGSARSESMTAGS